MYRPSPLIGLDADLLGDGFILTNTFGEFTTNEISRPAARQSRTRKRCSSVRPSSAEDAERGRCRRPDQNAVYARQREQAGLAIDAHHVRAGGKWKLAAERTTIR